MKGIVILILAITCLCEDDKFKGDDIKSNSMTPPTIRIPDNFRIRVNITEFFNIAIGLDLVLNFIIYSLLTMEC